MAMLFFQSSGKSPWVICDSFLSLTPKTLGSFSKTNPKLDCHYPGPSHHCLLPDYWNLLSGLCSCPGTHTICSQCGKQNVDIKVLVRSHQNSLLKAVSHGLKAKFPTYSTEALKWPTISRPTHLTSSPATHLIYPSLTALASSNMEEHSGPRAFALAVLSHWTMFPQIPACLVLSLLLGLYTESPFPW